MSCSLPRRVALLVCLALGITGCFPTQPVYLNESGDLSYYLDRATSVEYPDVETASLEEVVQSRAPITVADPNFDSFWDLSLEEAVSIALQNSKVIRGYGTPGLQSNRVAPGIDNLANGPAGAGTTYNIGVRESEPGFISTPGQISPPGSVVSNTSLDANQGVEAALADFDAQFTTSVFWEKSDSPRNNIAIEQVPVFQQDSLQFQTQLAKRTADGTQLFVRSVSGYIDNNIRLFADGGNQALRSIWQTALEAEIRQPLLRGRGAFINRMPVVISRIGTDQEIANLESQLQNMVANVEIRYWDLYCAYRNLESAKYGRDSALVTWRIVQDKYKEDAEPIQREAQAREQYFFFRAEVERAWADLLDAESNLRWLLGIASTDGRLIRPCDEPLKAPVHFDYCESLDEAIHCRPELRQERWEVKKRQLALAYAKNSLLPTLNAFGEYRWLGVGDRLISYDDPANSFPPSNPLDPTTFPGSGAWNELLGGSYQEFRMGLEAGIPVGFRRELANVQNAQLKLAREMARIEDMELDVTRELQHALRALDTNYQLAQTNFNRWASTTTEVESATRRYEAGRDTLDLVLEAQRRRAQAEISYYQSLCEFNKVIALVHRRKGTSLAYCGVHFDEGPWTGKAYYDAEEYARKRSASREVNYGWTRPEVISQGPGSGDCGCESCDVDSHDDLIYDSNDVSPGVIYEQNFSPDIQMTPSEPLEELPRVEPNSAPRQAPESQPIPAPADEKTQPQPVDTSTTMRIVPQPPATTMVAQPGSAKSSVAKIKWEKIGLTKPDSASQGTQATIRLVNHVE